MLRPTFIITRHKSQATNYLLFSCLERIEDTNGD